MGDISLLQRAEKMLWCRLLQQSQTPAGIAQRWRSCCWWKDCVFVFLPEGVQTKRCLTLAQNNNVPFLKCKGQRGEPCRWPLGSTMVVVDGLWATAQPPPQLHSWGGFFVHLHASFPPNPVFGKSESRSQSGISQICLEGKRLEWFHRIPNRSLTHQRTSLNSFWQEVEAPGIKLVLIGMFLFIPGNIKNLWNMRQKPPTPQTSRQLELQMFCNSHPQGKYTTYLRRHGAATKGSQRSAAADDGTRLTDSTSAPNALSSTLFISCAQS